MEALNRIRSRAPEISYASAALGVPDAPQGRDNLRCKLRLHLGRLHLGAVVRGARGWGTACPVPTPAGPGWPLGLGRGRGGGRRDRLRGGLGEGARRRLALGGAVSPISIPHTLPPQWYPRQAWGAVPAWLGNALGGRRGASLALALASALVRQPPAGGACGGGRGEGLGRREGMTSPGAVTSRCTPRNRRLPRALRRSTPQASSRGRSPAAFSSGGGDAATAGGGEGEERTWGGDFLTTGLIPEPWRLGEGVEVTEGIPSPFHLLAGYC